MQCGDVIFFNFDGFGAVPIFYIYGVSQRPKMRHLCEPQGGTEGLLETVGFKKTMKSMW